MVWVSDTQSLSIGIGSDRIGIQLYNSVTWGLSTFYHMASKIWRGETQARGRMRGNSQLAPPLLCSA